MPPSLFGKHNKYMRYPRSLSHPARYGVLVAGGLPVLAFPDLNLEPLAWVALVPGLLLMRASPTRREAIVRGCWFGAGYLILGQYWLTPSLGPAILLVAIVLGLAWFAVGLAAWAYLRPPLTTRRAAAALAVVPSAWLLGEWLRSWQGLGGPWAVYGASQWQHPVVLALAALGGVWLVSFALVLANTGVVIAVVARKLTVRLLGAAGLAAAIATGPVAYALTSAVPVTGRVTILLVQAGYHHPRLVTDERLTARYGRGTDLIVWGESSVSYDFGTHRALFNGLTRLSARVGAELLVNQDYYHGTSHSKLAALIGPNGIDGTYEKTRLVPFGEYIPFRPVLGWLSSISKAAATNMIPGSGAHDLTATLPSGSAGPRKLRFGVLICFESAFPDMSRVDTVTGARLIVYQTSDSTFQGSWALAQHASLGAVRAAETGRPVVQAALTGDSAAFDSRGRLLAWAGPDVTGVRRVTLSLPPTSYLTPFDRLGDYVPWIAVGIAIASALVGQLRGARAGRAWPRRRSAADAKHDSDRSPAGHTLS